MYLWSFERCHSYRICVEKKQNKLFIDIVLQVFKCVLPGNKPAAVKVVEMGLPHDKAQKVSLVTHYHDIN